MKIKIFVVIIYDVGGAYKSETSRKDGFTRLTVNFKNLSGYITIGDDLVWKKYYLKFIGVTYD